MTIVIIERRSACLEIFGMAKYDVKFVLAIHVSVICLLFFS
jgi:hypothetical protein